MKRRWIERLSPEDATFLKRFVLASGSLKAMAQLYGVSYPTIRQRLDRLITKIELFDADEPYSEFERSLRATFADGKIDQPTFERLLAAHREDLNNAAFADPNATTDSTNDSAADPGDPTHQPPARRSGAAE